MKIEGMEERAKKLHQHVQNNPADYQSVIAELKLRSAIIDRARKDAVDARLKRVAQLRREYEEQR